MTPGKTLLFATLCASAMLVAPTHVRAQAPMAAIGKPLMSNDLPVGTITVRIVAGAPSSPVIGTDVTLVVNGQPRIARTDSAGRANFSGLSAGNSVQAMVRDLEGKEVTSESFNVPSEGGARVMLTTKPWNPGAQTGQPSPGAMEPAAAAGGAMPSPRSLSGQPRIEQAYAPDSITVIASYDDLKDTVADLPISLVAYHSDESIKVTVKSTNSLGRAEFANLDRSGNTLYFAMAQLVRGAVIDRTYMVPVQLDSRGGVHVILSGEKRDSTKPAVDEFVQAQDAVTEPGKVRVVISGVPELPVDVKIFDATTKQVVAEGKAMQSAADLSRVDFKSQFAPRPDIPVGMLGVVIHGGAGKDAALSGIAVALVPAVDGSPALETPLTGTTDENGQAIIKVPATVTGPLKAVLTINGKQHTSDPVEVTTSGGALEVIAHWEDKGRIETMIDVPHIVGRVLYAESTNRKRTYRSAPFQTIPTSGIQLAMYFYPRTMFTFSMVGFVEDQLMGVQGKFSITNFSWFPYSAGPDGLLVPLPKGYRGVFVGDTDQDKVATDPVAGFRVLRPIPPGGLTFHGGFSIPIESDRIRWQQDLPLGTVNSSLKFLKIPSMVVHAPPGYTVRDGQLQNGADVFLMEPIQIKSGQSIALSVSGLPSMPKWRIWVPRIIGLVVVATMLAGIAFALVRRKTATGATAQRAFRRNQLLDELVELDRTGASKTDKRRRETLIVELEALWGDDNT